ncbi:MAG: hypothetical protein ACP5VS_04820 [Desulfomonilaceae bacterium]
MRKYSPIPGLMAIIMAMMITGINNNELKLVQTGAPTLMGFSLDGGEAGNCGFTASEKKEETLGENSGGVTLKVPDQLPFVVAQANNRSSEYDDEDTDTGEEGKGSEAGGQGGGESMYNRRVWDIIRNG